jgi:hypothetical protein
MSVHSKVNCWKIHEYMYANEINKIGDSYLPCIAMAHSPQITQHEHKICTEWLTVTALQEVPSTCQTGVFIHLGSKISH